MTQEAARPTPEVDLLCRFVNTRGIMADEPYAREELGTPESLANWWRRNGLHLDSATGSDLTEAHDVREGLRALMATHNNAAGPHDAYALAELETLTSTLPLISVPSGEDGVILRPGTSGTAREGLGWLLVALTVGQADGQWSRAKVCADLDCREAFRDTTRNHSRTWCSMQVCGARAKQRTFSTRRRTP